MLKEVGAGQAASVLKICSGEASAACIGLHTGDRVGHGLDMTVMVVIVVSSPRLTVYSGLPIFRLQVVIRRRRLLIIRGLIGIAARWLILAACLLLVVLRLLLIRLCMLRLGLFGMDFALIACPNVGHEIADYDDNNGDGVNPRADRAFKLGVFAG